MKRIQFKIPEFIKSNVSIESTSLLLRRLAPVTGILALVTLSFFISWKDVWARFKDVNHLYVIPSIFFNIAFILVETLRLKWVLEYKRLGELLRTFSLSRIIGIGTVHVAGEGALVGGLKLSGISIKNGAATIVTLRCLDLGVLCVVVGLFGISFFNLSIALLGFGLIVFFFWRRRRSPLLGEVILSSLFMYLFFSLSIIASAKAVGIEIGEINVIRVSAVGVISQTLPLTPFGLGTRDLSLIALFSSFHIPRETALVFSWIEFIVASVVSLCIIFAASLIWDMSGGRVPINETKKGSQSF